MSQTKATAKLDEFKTDLKPSKQLSKKTKTYIFIILLILFLGLTVYVSYSAIQKNKEIPSQPNYKKILVGEIDIEGISENDYINITNNLNLTVPENTAYCLGNSSNNNCIGTLIKSGTYKVTCEKENEILALCYVNISNKYYVEKT